MSSAQHGRANLRTAVGGSSFLPTASTVILVIALILTLTTIGFRATRSEPPPFWLWVPLVAMVLTAGLFAQTLLQARREQTRLFGVLMSTHGFSDEERERSRTAVSKARKEAEVLRRATLALAQGEHMDTVLDQLLLVLAGAVPYCYAGFFVQETRTQWLALAEKWNGVEASPPLPTVLRLEQSTFVRRLMRQGGEALIADTAETDWQLDVQELGGLRSWLSVPLSFANENGLLAVGHRLPRQFTPDHRGYLKLLAVPSSAAVQALRSLERAEIYRSEVERLMKTGNDARD